LHITKHICLRSQYLMSSKYLRILEEGTSLEVLTNGFYKLQYLFALHEYTSKRGTVTQNIS